MHDFLALARSQRAHRAFRPDPVPLDVVARVLEAATHAPSAMNRQPWRFVVVTDEATRIAIGDLGARAWGRGGSAHAATRLDTPLLDAVDRGARGGVAGAPVLVVVGSSDADLRGASESSIWPAVQNLLLAATAAGLGSALTTLPTMYPDELRAVVGFPPNVTPRAVNPLGWPARRLGPGRRLPVGEVASHDRFGQPFPG